MVTELRVSAFARAAAALRGAGGGVLERAAGREVARAALEREVARAAALRGAGGGVLERAALEREALRFFAI